MWDKETEVLCDYQALVGQRYGNCSLKYLVERILTDFGYREDMMLTYFCSFSACYLYKIFH